MESLTALAGDGLAGVLAILLPLGMSVFGFACWAFAWAVRRRQFDNLDLEAERILFEAPTTRPRTDRVDDAAREVRRP